MPQSDNFNAEMFQQNPGRPGESVGSQFFLLRAAASATLLLREFRLQLSTELCDLLLEWGMPLSRKCMASDACPRISTSLVSNGSCQAETLAL